MQVTKTQISIKTPSSPVLNSAVLERLIKEVKQINLVQGNYDRVHNRHNR